MSSIVTESQTVPLSGSRGRLRPAAAASVARIDAALGRPLDINSAWRDPKQQDRLHAAYVRDPAHNPLALPSTQSIHCRGTALDTDDHTPAMVRLLGEHGWQQTVYRNGKLVEPWHFEYDPTRDRHRGDPTPTATRRRNPDMPILSVSTDRPDKKRLYWLAGDNGIIAEWVGEGYARAVEKQIGAPAAPCLDSLRLQIIDRFKQQDVNIINADELGVNVNVNA